MVEGLLIDAEYVTLDERAVLRLWCKGKEVFAAYDKNFKPYFYVFGIDEETIEKAVLRTKKGMITPESYERKNVKTFGEEKEAFIIYVKHPQHVPKLREIFSEFGEVREADIPFAYRYLIDKDLACMDGVNIEGREILGRIRSYEIDIIERINTEIPELNILAFDCEMLSSLGMPDPERDPIIVIAAKWGEKEGEEVILHGDERTMLQEFVEIIRRLDPDVIVGYNQDAFDWPYIRKRAEKLKVPLEIGRDGSSINFKGGRPKIPGRLNVDLYDIAMRISDIKIKKLENVAEFLGTKVEIEDIEARDINKYWEKEREKVLLHAKRDVLHTFMIARELLPMHSELSRLIRLPLDDVSRMGRGKQVDWLLLSEAKKFGEVAPNAVEVAESYEGAFVIEPERGLHENVVELDFASMYPSIMIEFNISPDTLSSSGDFVAPEVGYRFKKHPDGFFRRILKSLIEKRREIKKMMKEMKESDPKYKLLDIKQQTLKILTNSFYGYMGWSGARWYCKECAEATTAWGRYFIKTSAKIAREMGFNVLYGDTDSIFVSKSLKIEDLKKEVERLIERISEELPVHIELDEFFKTIFFIEKKRYAGITVEGKTLIRGLEVRRGDWCELAKKAQKEVIEILLREKNPEKAMNFVIKVIEDIKSGRIKLDELVIYKGLTKKPSKYEAVQAHVKAAKKAEEIGIFYPVGSKIGYIVVRGAGSVGDRAFPIEMVENFDGDNLKIRRRDCYEVKKIDKDYYIDHQILPAVMRILERFGYSEKKIKSSQTSLDSFFE
ncbi:MAG: DNA-directed DNA polymerase [Archaeoglobaceae archaeon]|nr:DNA-directed DNA polymerase [Archaeoglobaceae archaeon]MDW7989499.1 DNA-directed DNA polymerase [Archaeoglobaceae archaeon]